MASNERSSLLDVSDEFESDSSDERLTSKRLLFMILKVLQILVRNAALLSRCFQAWGELRLLQSVGLEPLN